MLKLLLPALDGGTDGDGLPPDFDFATRGGTKEILSTYVSINRSTNCLHVL